MYSEQKGHKIADKYGYVTKNNIIEQTKMLAVSLPYKTPPLHKPPLT